MRDRRLWLGVLVGLLCAIGLAFWLHARPSKAQEAAHKGETTATNTPGDVTSTSTGADDRVRQAVISGRVMDDGATPHPIAGAMVCADASSEKLVSADTKRPRCAQTDAKGEYAIRDLPSARYIVDAAAPSFQPARYRDEKRDAGFRLKPGETREHVDFVLEHGGVEVRGHVRDISGGVVIGALVRVVAGTVWDPIGTAITNSGPQGDFTVWLPAGPVTATALAIGYTEGTKDGVAPGQLIEILVTPESVLQGRVVEAGTDTPVAGARVVSGPVQAQNFLSGSSTSDSALTDADGRFRIGGIAPGRYQPTATSEHRTGTTKESVLLGLAESSRDLVIEMHSTPSLLGRIELEDKTPCTLGGVSLKGAGMKESQWNDAGPDGRVRVEGLFPGTYTVEIWCSHTAGADHYDPIVIHDKDVTAVWRVNTGFTASGVVVDASGAPVASASVQAHTSGGDPRARSAWNSAQTEKDGTFKLRGLLTAKYALTVQRDGAVPLADPVEVDVQHNVDGVRIQLPAGGGIDGKVVDGSGAPVSGVDVSAKGDRLEWGSGRTISRDDGSFAFPALRPGTYHVQALYRWAPVRAPDTKDDDVQGTLATVTVTEKTHVKLVVESQNNHIDGNVVDDNGVALSDAFVEAERESDSAGAASGDARRAMAQWSWGTVRSPVLTDLDGHFTVTKLSAGSYTVRAFRKGGGESVVEDVKVGTSVTIKIKKEGSISGTLADAKGAVPDRFSVTLNDQKTGVSRQETFLRTGGVWAIRDLPAGDFIVAGEAAGRAQTTVSLAQGEDHAGVVLTLAANATARGRMVSLETNEPVAGMMVFVVAHGGESNMIMNDLDMGDRKNVSDADGRFELADAPPGRVTIMAMPKDQEAAGSYAFVMVPATLAAGATVDLPPIRVVKRRVQGELEGDLGMGTQEPTPGTDLADMKELVSSVRPNGPAAKAGVVVGDEVVAVDGYDVTAPNQYLSWALLSVPAGTTVKVGLRRGAIVNITAVPPSAPPPAK